MFPSFPHYKEGTGGRGQIEPGPPVVPVVNFPRANAILARAQALLWVRDCNLVLLYLWFHPMFPGEHGVEHYSRRPRETTRMTKTWPTKYK